MALSCVSPLYISPNFLQSRSKPFTVVCRIEPQRKNRDREPRNWQRLVSAALAAAVVTLSPLMPAVADFNKFEAQTGGEFGTGSAALFTSADLRRGNFASADMKVSDFSGSTFNSPSLEKAVADKSNFTGSDAPRARPRKIIFHPSTGLCVLRKSPTEPLKLGPCTEAESWAYTPQKILRIKGTYFCIQAVGLGKPAKLSIICNEPGSNWEKISDSKMYLSTKLEDGTIVCLDVDSSNQIVTNSCNSLNVNDMFDPESQWFKIADVPIPRMASSSLDFIFQLWIMPKRG